MSDTTVNKKMTTKKSKGSRNRRKSREIALKAIYRIMMNEGDIKQVFLDMKDDPDYNKADEKNLQANTLILKLIIILLREIMEQGC